MKTPRHDIAAIVAKKTLSPSVRKSALSRSIAAYLLATGRTGELSSLIRDIMQDRTDEGIVEVTAVSAHDLDSATEAKVKSEVRKLYTSSKKIIINQVIDPEMIGGIRLDFANQQLDLSLRAKLNRFKQLTVLGEIK